MGLEGYYAELPQAIITTLSILVVAIPISIAWGIFLGSARVYGGKILSTIATGFVVLFRGFPLIVTLLFIFYGLPEIGIYLTPFWSAVLGFILCSGAYQSEYVRGAIRSIDMGQIEAARSLGMTKFQELIHIVLPQALRRALPGISNEVIYLNKYSSLAYAIGVIEIFQVSKKWNSWTFEAIPIFLTAAAIYLTINTVTTLGFRALEHKLRIPGLEIEKTR